MFMLLIGFRYVYASLSFHERHLFLPCAWSPDDRALFSHDMRLIDVTHEVPTSLLFVFSPLLLFDVRVFQCKFAAARVCFLSPHFLGKLDLLPMQAPIYTLAFRCMPVFFRRVFSERLGLLPAQAPVVMFCPWKKSCAVGRIGLYTFLRFASSPRLLCPTRILNEMNIKCRMALGASDQQLNIRTQRRPKLTKTGKSAIRSQTMENSHISAKK